MRLGVRSPLLSDIALLSSCVLLISGGLAFESFAQSRHARPEQVQAQLLSYYRRYPDRYISVMKHSWHLDVKTRTSFHSLTLRNSAGVAYGDIEICLSYQTPDGKTAGSQTVRIPGRVAPYQTLDIRRLPVRGAHPESDSVLVSVTRASIYK